MVSRREVLRVVPLVLVTSTLTAPATALAATSPYLSDDEIRGLLYMREEEKLARDTYAVQYRQWHTAVFDNIRSSEVNHMAAIANLLSRYGLADPAAGNGEGEFENQALQTLYNALAVQAGRSLPDALIVGTAIEEIDIIDLKEHLSHTDESPIQQVYGNLLEGSYNHLRAFVRLWTQITGDQFAPQYLDQATADAILGTTSGANGPGGRRR